MNPDRQELVRFVAAMFKHANPEGYVVLQAYQATQRFDDLLFRQAILLGDQRFLDVVYEQALVAAQNPIPASFCPPISTFAADGSLLEGLCIRIDLDFLPSAGWQRMERLLGPATLVVASGGLAEGEPRLHLYWRLKSPAIKPMDHALLDRACWLATRLAMGDRGAGDLRWPGSVHSKGDPVVVRIVCESDAEIDLHEAVALLGAARPETVDTAALIDMEDQLDEFAGRIIEQSRPLLLELFLRAAAERGLSLTRFLVLTLRTAALGSN